jgi:iron complex transport system substrate-binding protein
MKVCSFLPASTEIIYRLGLEKYLCGVTFECPSDKPKVVRSPLEGNTFSSLEIEKIVATSKAQGKSLYYIDEDLLQELSPDIIFTQDVCEVCQIDTAYVQRAVYKLKKQPLIVPLLPKSLNDVYDSILTIAKAMEKEENAYRLLASLTHRTDFIIDKLRENRTKNRRVMLMEWLNPIYNCGHWIPDQIASAGGVDMLSNPGGYSIKVDWEKVRLYNPEVLVVAPCGLEIERAVQEIGILENLPGWNDLKAVKNNEVYFADSNLFTCPGTQLVDGIELLAYLFHPETFYAFKQQHATHFKKVNTKVIV